TPNAPSIFARTPAGIALPARLATARSSTAPIPYRGGHNDRGLRAELARWRTAPRGAAERSLVGRGVASGAWRIVACFMGASLPSQLAALPALRERGLVDHKIKPGAIAPVATGPVRPGRRGSCARGRGPPCGRAARRSGARA